MAADVFTSPRASREPREGRLWQALRHDPLVQWFFLSLLLLGSDRIAITVAGMTLRVVFPILMITCSFLYMKVGGKISFDKPAAFLFLMLAIAGAASTINSGAAVKSVGYTIWVLFDFIAIISLCYNFAKLYAPDLTVSIWMFVFRIHSVLIILELAHNLMNHTFQRPQLWFYEPSFLAIFMSAYFAGSLYGLLSGGRKYLLDFFMSVAAMIMLASATAVFGMAFGIIINMVVAKQRVKLLVVSAVIGSVFLGTLYAFFHQSLYFRLVAGFLFRADTLHYIFLRGGDRWIRVLIGWNAFLHHPWLGVGIGGDDAYTKLAAFPPSAMEFLRPWADPREGEPFCNVFVAVLGTTGLIGFIPFLGVILYALWAMRGLGRRPPSSVHSVIFLIGFIATLMAMQLDGTVLRYYLWSPLGLGLGVIARSEKDRLLLSGPVGTSVSG